MSHFLIEVGEMTGYLRPSSDLQCFFYRIQESISKFVAQVSVVDAAMAGCFGRQCNQLVGVRVTPWWVIKSGREAECSILHAFPKHSSHARYLSIACGSFVPSHRGNAEWCVSDYVGDVDRYFGIKHAEIF